MTNINLWQRYCQNHLADEALGFAMDISRMNFKEDFFDRMTPAMQQALGAMQALEAGAIANPDENRMVGHYWLRQPDLAPDPALRQAILDANEQVLKFAQEVHAGRLRGGKGEPFTNFLLVGIGGSALGPQLVADALGTDKDQMKPYFMDNTDPDGILRTLGSLEGRLDRTLVIVISKSGGTQETKNGMLETQAAYARAGLDFARHAVSVTSEGSALHKMTQIQHWLRTFPMWDWVGGRTSITSAVGLLPAALQGLPVERLLLGAREMDTLTRRGDIRQNPAALLALMWHYAGNGRGTRDMVVLPYKDRLVLFSKYLQQLVMESIGKELDLQGNVVNQGLAVYGNKGSTDQHAYVQQLREGLDNFFVTFIEVQQDNAGSLAAGQVQVEPAVNSGDYLFGFLLGTRQALMEKERESITLTIRTLDARSLGALIALFERAVGLYAALVGINAYHQPGVEAGKKAAKSVITIQTRLLEAMAAGGAAQTAEAWAGTIGETAQIETIFKLLDRLAANADRKISKTAGSTPAEAKFAMEIF